MITNTNTDKLAVHMALTYEQIVEEISFASKNSADHDVEFARRILAAAGSVQQAEPVAWANGDELDNMLDDRVATVAGEKSGQRTVALYLAASTAQEASKPRPLTQAEHEVMRSAQLSSGTIVARGKLVQEASKPVQAEAATASYVQTVIDALYENSDPVSVDAAELLKSMAASPAAPAVQERDMLLELLRRARGYVDNASKRFYDGTDGESIRNSARHLLKQIDRAALASPPAGGEKQG